MSPRRRCPVDALKCRTKGLFESDEEAFSHGRVLVKVSVSRARGLTGFAVASAAEAAAGLAGPATFSPPEEEQVRVGPNVSSVGGI